MVKRVLTLILTTIILIGVMGCMEKQNELSVNEQVEKYMKDKYNEEFKVTGGGTEGWNSPDTEIYVRSEKFPDENIMIRRGKETGEMIDNYVSFLKKAEIEKVMTDIVSPIYPKSKVLYMTSGSPQSKATPEMSVDEYLKYCSDYLGFSITICIDDADYKSNKDQKLEQLRKEFEKREYISGLSIFYVKDGKLDLIDDKNVNELFTGATEATWSTLRGDFSMNDSYKFDDYSEWREIK